MRQREQIGAAMRAAILTVTMALAAAASACGNNASDLSEEAPARGGQASAGGEVEGPPPGGFANGGNAFDSVPAAGVAGSGTAVAGGAAGNTAVSPGEGTLQSGSPSDAAVTSVIDAINGSEVELSQLAAEKAQNPEVRRYATDMIAAHRMASLDRGVEARGRNSASDLPQPIRDMHLKTMQALQATPAGPDFDHAFITAQVQAHQGALQTLERLETAARNPALTDRLRQMQSEVRRHLDRARAIQSRIPNPA
jgi:putative membrane protein